MPVPMLLLLLHLLLLGTLLPQLPCGHSFNRLPHSCSKQRHSCYRQPHSCSRVHRCGSHIRQLSGSLQEKVIWSMLMCSTLRVNSSGSLRLITPVSIHIPHPPPPSSSPGSLYERPLVRSFFLDLLLACKAMCPHLLVVVIGTKGRQKSHDEKSCLGSSISWVICNVNSYAHCWSFFAIASHVICFLCSIRQKLHPLLCVLIGLDFSAPTEV